MKSSDLKAVLFDMDGTLINSRISDTLSFQNVIKENLGLTINKEQMKGYFGTPTKLLLSKFVSESQIDKLYQCWLNEKLNNSGLVQIFPGILETILLLRNRGMKTAVVTSQFSSESEITRKQFKLDSYFDAWVTSDDAKFHKPDPEPVRVALKKLNVKPINAVMIGDTINDLDAGRSAGTLIAAALWGASDKDILIQRQPEFLFHSTKEVMSLVT